MRKGLMMKGTLTWDVALSSAFCMFLLSDRPLLHDIEELVLNDPAKAASPNLTGKPVLFLRLDPTVALRGRTSTTTCAVLTLLDWPVCA